MTTQKHFFLTYTASCKEKFLPAMNKFAIEEFILWNITLCTSLKVNQCFRESGRLHLQGLNAKPTK